MSSLLTSTFNTMAVISYVRRRRPEAVPLLLEGLDQMLGLGPGETEALLNHAGRWVPLEVQCEMLRRAREDIFQDPRASYRLSLEAVCFHNWGPLKTLYLRLLGSPGSLIRAAPWLVRRFSQALDKIRASDLDSTGCRLHLTWKPHPALNHDNCLTIMGGIASLPLRWGYPPAQVVEEQCAFQGHPTTVLRLSWSPLTWRKRLGAFFRGVNAGRARFLVDSLNQHARQVELLTEQSREMARALAQEQMRFKALAENIPMGLAFLDAQGRFLYTNPALSDMVGYPRGELVDLKQWRELIYPDPGQRRQVEDCWQQDMDQPGVSTRNFRVRCAQGEEKDVRFLAGSLAEGERFILMEDVTQRLAAENHLTRSESLMRAVVEGSPDSVLVLDRQGRVIMVNHQALEVLGVKGPVQGRPWQELLPPEWYSWGQALWEWMNQGKVVREELELSLPGQEGTSVFELLAVSLDGGTAIINLRDITHRHRLEQERQRAARLTGVVELAGTAAHELNQPLTSLLASSELMEMYREVPDLKRQAARIRQDALRMARLVERFGRIVRYETKEYLPGRRIIDLDKAARQEDSLQIPPLNKSGPPLNG